MSFLRTLCLLVSISKVKSWFCDGHMLVAAVALKSGLMSQSTITLATELIDYLAADYPMTPAFTESACWADDLKSTGVTQEANWHFIDLPICRLADTTACPSPQDDNVVWAITSAHSTVYSKKAAMLDRARQLRFIIHFVGDIHQPLHAATLIDAQFPPPTGDRGGNSYLITGFDWTTELHALWDGGMGQWYGDIPRPLNATGSAWLDNFTSTLLGQYPISSLGPEIANVNVTSWADESNTLADTFVYTAPQSPTPVPDSYVQQGIEICNLRVALAGYRLASLLEYIFTVGALSDRVGSL